MSNIKLRFWCDTHGYVKSGFGEPIECVYFNQRDELGLPCPFCHKSRPMTLERWTGHQDKKGMEIYEGDVVEMIGYEYGLSEFNRFEVVFDLGMFGVPHKSGGVMALFGNEYDRSKVEVIGNVRENPELVEDES